MPSPSSHERSAEHELAEVAWVRRLAVAMVRDEHAADDIAQDALVASVRRPPAVVGQRAGWFVRVIRNLTRFRARSDARRTEHEQLAAQPDHPEDPSRSIERLELQEELLRAVRALPEPYRGTVLQRWFEALEPSEIARRAGIPVSTVHTRSSRALGLLRQHLDRRSGGDRASWTMALLPLLAKASSNPLPVFALNLKLKVAVAVALALGLLTTAWLVIPVRQASTQPLVSLHEESPAQERSAPEDRPSAVAVESTQASADREALHAAVAVDPGALLVRVRDDLGPLGRYAIRVVGPEHPDELRGLEDLLQEHASGESSLKVDQQGFSVQIVAELHLPLVLGPFDRSPGTLDATLERRPGIRGHVRHEGRPIADALVSLHEAVPAGRRTWKDGLLVRSRDELVKGKSVSDGAFALPLQKRGRYWIRARMDGLADAELGPFDLDPTRGKDGLLLELTRGGSIEGKVFLPEGESLAESRAYTLTLGQFGAPVMRETVAPFEVVATRGDGFAHRVRPDADGRFRLDGLTPGAWCVMRDPGVRQTENDDGPGFTPEYANCEVLLGVVTQHDLDLRSGPEVKLSVSAQVGSMSCAGWKLRVAAYWWRGTSVDGFQDLGPDGRLEVATLPGPVVLHANGRLGPGVTIDIREQKVLEPGPTTWGLVVPAGALEGRMLETGRPEKGRSIELHWSAEPRDALCTVQVGTDGRFSVPTLPAGSWKASNPNDPASRVVPFVVGSGETTRLELPW